MSRSPNQSVNVKEAAAESLGFSGRNGPSALQNGLLNTHFASGHAPQGAAHDDLSFETEDMRARMTIALEEHLHDHPDMSSLLPPSKLSIETSTSPKPCIVPGNALQLIDDDPASASRSHTPSSITIVDDDPHGHHDHEAGGECCNEQEPARRPMPRVRFRSRVRIGSGLRRSRHHADPTSTPESSTSGSPSSSISVPLRWQADENAAWGPIGRRLSAFAQINGWSKRSPSSNSARGKHERQQQQRPQQQPHTPSNVGRKGDEREPLLGSVRHVAYVDAGLEGGWLTDDARGPLVRRDSGDTDDEERALLADVEELEFGKWPWRVFSRHWWWRKTEPVLCCLCADVSDEGE